jgi:hypothetical protein
MTPHVPTSTILAKILDEAPPDSVTLGWFIGNLQERSFGVVMLLLALLGLVPGVSPIMGVLLAIVAVQMMLDHPNPVLPRFIASRKLSTKRIAALIQRLVPWLRRLERFVHPRWSTPIQTTKRAVGFVILLLGLMLLAPVPLSNIVPVLVIMTIAVAFLEEDGLLLCLGGTAAMLLIAFAGLAVWGSVETIDLLERL